MDSKRPRTIKMLNFVRTLSTKLLHFLKDDNYRTIVVISNRGTIKINDGQTRKVLATFDFNDVNNGKLDNSLRGLKRNKIRASLIGGDSDTLKKKSANSTPKSRPCISA